MVEALQSGENPGVGNPSFRAIKENGLAGGLVKITCHSEGDTVSGKHLANACPAEPGLAKVVLEGGVVTIRRCERTPQVAKLIDLVELSVPDGETVNPGALVVGTLATTGL